MRIESPKGNEELKNKIIQWAYSSLSSLGYQLKNKLPENIKATPWSYVVRFETSEGYIYLKHMPQLLALEAEILAILSNQFHATIPVIIANNAQLNCFLMKDAGTPLREILKKQFDVNLLCKAIDQFTSLQIAASNSVSIFLDIGVPDWRLAKLPDLYQNLILQKDLLIENGLSENEINELELLIPRVTHLCKKLASYSIKESIVQPDFHDNNLLIDNGSKTITLIDLGEIVISHPFFSLVNFLRQVQFHHALTDKEILYLQLVNACFESYRNFESKEHLQDAFLIAHTLWFIFEALAHYRLMLACDKTKFKPFQESQKLGSSLNEFVSACVKLNC